MKHNSEVRELFNTKSVGNPNSLVNFYIQDQVTVQGVGLDPSDVITFEMFYLETGSVPEVCDCIILPGSMPTVQGAATLMCGDCDEGSGEGSPVRLTLANPVVVLDHPQGAIIRAVYSGPGLGESKVWITTATETQDLTPELRGCPPANCQVGEVEEGCEPDPELDTPTGLTSCEDFREEEGIVVYTYGVQVLDSCGTLRWDYEVLPARPTGGVLAAGFSTVVPQNQEEGAYSTGFVIRQYESECGKTAWLDDLSESVMWVPHGSHCAGNLEVLVEVNQFGQTRFVQTDRTCGLPASLILPNGCHAFLPEEKPFDANVVLEDCDGTVGGYLYDEPRHGATCEVLSGCPGDSGCADVLLVGYGVCGAKC